MKTLLKSLALFFFTVSASALAFADEDSGFAVGVKTGLTGHGIELVFPVSDSLNIRATTSRFSVDESLDETDVSYDAKMKIGATGILADWYPFSGNFRLSTGLLKNISQFDLTAKPTNGTYAINGEIYNADEIGALTGKLSFSKSPAPYFGMGWGNAASGGKLGFTIDLGVILQHPPTTQLDVQCGAALPEVECALLRSNVQAAQVELDDKMKKLRAYPVISAGITLHF